MREGFCEVSTNHASTSGLAADATPFDCCRPVIIMGGSFEWARFMCRCRWQVRELFTCIRRKMFFSFDDALIIKNHVLVYLSEYVEEDPLVGITILVRNYILN